ncbi:MAG: gamma-glutamyl-gamma-aminobutyrate hydrolase family protein [Anaerolineae bacterium]|nr:gamma-glutamyl-gamma-aminobutyrate hydrolase family protein [Anaerolineae bacterium]MDK1117205.1 gamma-glutamyl-gamma-aminobutyrate hydrolase family protein [Anaerolineae bacterium]
MQPVIGLTTTEKINDNGLPIVMMYQAYIRALIKAGGVPVLIPSRLTDGGWQVLFERLDGVLLAGGGDIEIKNFNGKDHPSIERVDKIRDSMELKLLIAAIDQEKPFLGICRGLQLVNVGLGGTLYTHLSDQFPNAIKHTYPDDQYSKIVHKVNLEEGSRLADIMGESNLNVNSLHHQGLKTVAPELIVTGYATDGLVEAVELPKHPFGFAVQWHPEWIPEQKPSQRLFQAFVDAAKMGIKNK